MVEDQHEAARPPHHYIRWILITAGTITIAGMIAFGIAYHRVSKQVDAQLAAGPFRHEVTYYAAPEAVSVGDAVNPSELAEALKRAGIGSTATEGSIRAHSAIPVEIQFAKGVITSIVDGNGRRVPSYEIPAQLITNLSSEGRSKRLMVHYSDMPPALVHAIVSAEDKRFFAHSGFDVPRIAKAMYVDMRERRKEQGASTISMQLARNLWLARDKKWKRKMREALITLSLERRLSKEQILEDYCNAVYLGGQGTFSINGFGEAARAYFNKDIQKLNLTESAMLAGLIQRPSYLNPFRTPRRVRERRNVVLALMRENKYITKAEYDEAVAAPLGLRPAGATGLSESQYFLDIANEEASKKLDERQDPGSAEVYTTLDLRLQRAAEQAIADGMQLVDKELAARRKRGQPVGPRPQVALIAIDPHTGEVKALCGGRDYAASQFDRVLSKRPPGSVFKPFVYTAALNTALTGGDTVLTPASEVDDSPTSFEYGNQTYSPSNFKHQFMGKVTLRYALAHSLNVATVKVGEMAGFDKVVAVAHQAGLNEDIKATPAVALGAYQVTPLEIARAYTMFANGGVLVQPEFISAIRDQNAEVYAHRPRTKQVLDPRVAYVMVDMLQEVMRSGTAAGVRGRGFKLPAAGKTGTSHDGWFAGFTSQLLCVVWVGFDDYSELGLEGAHSALPIWTDFMMDAARYKEYGNAKPFAPPQGVVKVSIDPASGDLAGPYCPQGAPSYFIDGTQPTTECTPQEIQLTPTADGGFSERSVPVVRTAAEVAARDR